MLLKLVVPHSSFAHFSTCCFFCFQKSQPHASCVVFHKKFCICFYFFKFDAECFAPPSATVRRVLQVENLCFREKSTLDVFDVKQCYDFSANIKWGEADHNILKRIRFLRLQFGVVLLKLFEPHASFAHLFRYVLFDMFVCYCF